MPNHVTTVITADTAVLEALSGENGLVDFNALIPMPKALKHLTAEFKVVKTSFEAEQINSRENASPMATVMGWTHETIHAITQDEHDKLRAEYGRALSWYDWNTTNWGTKWNAYSIEGDPVEGTIQFDTAWSHPEPIIEALSKKFPEAVISVKFADEDLGSNLGEYTIVNGEEIDSVEFDFGSDEATEYACQLKYGQTYAELRAEYEEE